MKKMYVLINHVAYKKKLHETNIGSQNLMTSCS